MNTDDPLTVETLRELNRLRELAAEQQGQIRARLSGGGQDNDAGRGTGGQRT